MPSNFRSASLSCLALIGCTAASFAAETILYSTDFSDFGIGDDLLVGTDGWLGTNQDEGIHGTIEGAFTDGNVAGTLGFGIPEFTEGNFIASIWRPINVDPIANDSLIRFSTDTAIIDSDNQLYDSFLFSVVNQDADVLGSIIFDNTVESFGIWRYDGVTDGFYDTEVSYEYANIYDLSFTVDFANNLWSATLDDISLFEDAPLTASEFEKNLGDVSAEWEVNDPDNAGTNWLYFDNWTVSEITEDSPTGITFTPSVIRGPNKKVRLNWPATNGETFQVEYSDNLQTWKQDLEGSNLTVTGNNGARFVDASAATLPTRYYRVSRR